MRAFVVEEAPFHSDENVARPKKRAGIVVLENLHWELELQLHVGQSVIEIEERRVHFGFAWRALDDERDVDFPAARRRWLRIVCNERRTRCRDTPDQQTCCNCYSSKNVQLKMPILGKRGLVAH